MLHIFITFRWPLQNLSGVRHSFSLQLDFHRVCVVLQSDEHTPFMNDQECNVQS